MKDDVLFRCYDICWDTEGEEVDLPNEVYVSKSLMIRKGYVPEATTNEEVQDRLVDYLSDEYEFCVFNFRVSATEKRRIANIERELFIAIVCESIIDKGDKRITSPDSVAEKLYDKYLRAADEHGTWMMCQEAANAVSNLLDGCFDNPCRCAELLAMNDCDFLERVSENAENSIMVALGFEE